MVITFTLVLKIFENYVVNRFKRITKSFDFHNTYTKLCSHYYYDLRHYYISHTFSIDEYFLL